MNSFSPEQIIDQQRRQKGLYIQKNMTPIDAFKISQSWNDMIRIYAYLARKWAPTPKKTLRKKWEDFLTERARILFL